MAYDIAYLTQGAAPMLASIMYYAGLALFALFIAGIAFFVFYIQGFKYKISYWEVVGNATKGLTVDKPRNTRAKWNKDKTAWILLYPLFKGREIEPFDDENIYPGKHCYAFRFGETFVPANININKDQTDIRPIPHHIRQWQKLELKQNELEFQKMGFWEQNKFIFLVIITAALCLGLVGVTVYYTYQFATGGRAEMSALTQAIKSITTYGGQPPA